MYAGIDLGYNYVKAIATTGREAYFPSVIGPYLEGRYSMVNGYKPLQVEGQTWNFGAEALAQSNYATSQRNADWLFSQTYRVLFSAALSELAQSTTTARVVVGLPLQDYNTHAVNLREALIGPWTFKRDRSQTVTIEDALVITQSYGALLNHALSSSGQITDAKWTGYVGVADLGGNTLNILTTDSFREVSRFTEGDGFGLLSALGEIARAIRSDCPGFNPQTHEIGAWLARGTFEYKGVARAIAPYTQALDPLVDLLLGRFSEVWREPGRMSAILLTGGGAALLGEKLKDRMSDDYPPITIGGQWDNSRGYLKAAKRNKKWK